LELNIGWEIMSATMKKISGKVNFKIISFGAIFLK